MAYPMNDRRTRNKFVYFWSFQSFPLSIVIWDLSWNRICELWIFANSVDVIQFHPWNTCMKSTIKSYLFSVSWNVIKLSLSAVKAVGVKPGVCTVLTWVCFSHCFEVIRIAELFCGYNRSAEDWSESWGTQSQHDQTTFRYLGRWNYLKERR